ncbi:MAG: hypothetical protein V4490_00620, partial [Pseudomonadota bacterium]
MVDTTKLQGEQQEQAQQSASDVSFDFGLFSTTGAPAIKAPEPETQGVAEDPLFGAFSFMTPPPQTPPDDVRSPNISDEATPASSMDFGLGASSESLTTHQAMELSAPEADFDNTPDVLGVEESTDQASVTPFGFSLELDVTAAPQDSGEDESNDTVVVEERLQAEEEGGDDSYAETENALE